MAVDGTFRGWLAEQIATQKIARRELARRLAAKHPAGVTAATIETYRRAIYRYLDPDDPMKPNQQTRAAFAEALGVDSAEMPGDDDEESDLEATLQALARDHLELSRRSTQALRAFKAAGK